MNFQESVMNCFKNYFKASGRASRSEFWWFALLAFMLIFLGSSSSSFAPVLSSFFYIGYLSMYIPLITAAVRRLHDTGKNGAFILVPIANIYWLSLPSDPSANIYGSPLVNLAKMAPPTQGAK